MRPQHEAVETRAVSMTPGARLGKLTVVREERDDGKLIAWLARCDCGRYAWVQNARRSTPVGKSCGCDSFRGGKFPGKTLEPAVLNLFVDTHGSCRQLLSTGPCEFASCRYWLDSGQCALSIVEEGGADMQRVGDLCKVSRQAIEQLEHSPKLARKLRVLKELHTGDEPGRSGGSWRGQTNSIGAYSDE